MQNKKQNLEVGQRVYVDFLSSNRVETDGTRISGFGVLDRVGGLPTWTRKTRAKRTIPCFG